MHTHMHNHRVKRITNYGTISGARILGARPVTNFDQPRVLACERFILHVQNPSLTISSGLRIPNCTFFTPLNGALESLSIIVSTDMVVTTWRY